MILELEAVNKFYGRFQALADITASIEPGAIGLLGPNGAGKSTLVKALLGLVKLTSGTARVLGRDTRTQSREIREHVGFMPEDDCSIAGMQGVKSVALTGELAGLPSRTALRRAHEMLDYVHLGDERYREVQTYSTGMRQRIKLAQALIHSPELVFLDEPTSGLDPDGRETMLKLIRNLAQRKGISVVVSTHILSDIESCCDAVVILGRGRLLVYDTMENLQRSVDSSCRVRVDGDPTALANALSSSDLEVAIEDGFLRVRSDTDDLAGQVFAAARSTGVVVREIVASRNSLEDTFLTAVRETETATAGGGVVG